MSAQSVCLKSVSPGHGALERQHLMAGARAKDNAIGTRCGLQRPEHAGHIGVAVAVVVGHVGRTLFFDQHPATGEQLHRAGDDFVQHRLHRFVGWLGNFDELRRPVSAAPAHAVQDQAVKVNVQVGGRAKALNQSDRTAVSLVGLEPSLAEQVPRDHAVHHLQHGRHQLGLCSQQQAPPRQN